MSRPRSASTAATWATRLVCPGHDGDYLKQATFRTRHWGPALRAAGVEHRGVYAIDLAAKAAGVQLF